jgi:hypothetical protein
MFATKALHDAVTERSPAYAILAIDSEDRFRDYDDAHATVASIGYNSSPYDFQITKNESIMNGFFTRLALTEINFPWVIPNINVRTSKIIVEYTIGGPSQYFQITLAEGFYKPAEIAAALQAAIIANNPAIFTGMIFQYSTAKGLPRFLYDSTGTTGNAVVAFHPMPYNNQPFRDLAGVLQPVAGFTPYPYPNSTKQMFDVLGFTRDNQDIAIPAQGGSTTFCQAIRYVDVICSQLTYNQALKDTMSQPVARDTLCRLYLGDGPYTGTSTVTPSDPNFCPPGCAPFTIYRQFTNPKFIRWLPNQPVQGNLVFQVYDDNGQLLSTYYPASPSVGFGYSAADWSMTLLVSED